LLNERSLTAASVDTLWIIGKGRIRFNLRFSGEIMLGIHNFGLFILSGVLLNLTPGTDTLFILSKSLGQGHGVGIASALGISAGTLVHTVAAAFGLSAILATSAVAFLIVKLVGAAYLVFLGIKLLFARESPFAVRAETTGTSSAVAFRQGVLTNVTNPKVALFFLAFMPQFIDPASSSTVAAFLLLGLTFFLTGAIWCVTLAVAASSLHKLFAASPRATALLSRVCGGLFIALGVRLAVSKQ
jgi:threonine/homoserine/homoserine lactone efflux protein